MTDMTRRNVRNPLVLCAAAIIGSLVAGCGDKLTPELQGITQRSIDVRYAGEMANNVNSREFSDDAGRVFYTDNPTRLSPYPIMFTSGQPD